jgi:hypothetical protein
VASAVPEVGRPVAKGWQEICNQTPIYVASLTSSRAQIYANTSARSWIAQAVTAYTIGICAGPIKERLFHRLPPSGGCNSPSTLIFDYFTVYPSTYRVRTNDCELYQGTDLDLLAERPACATTVISYPLNNHHPPSARRLSSPIRATAVIPHHRE